MRKEPLISVIVNVYDSVPKLKKCLDTLLFQLYKNIEIICIDNGLSAEATGVLYSYKAQDNRFEIIHHTNSNSASAWDYGFKPAKGEYVHFVNSNCWALLDLYKVFADSYQENDFDIYMFNAALYSEKFIDVPYYEFFDDEDIISFTDSHLYKYKDIDHILTKNLRVLNKIYKKDFLERKLISFSENNNYCEHLFNLQTLVKSDSIYINPETYLRSSEQLIEEGKNTYRVSDIFKIIIDIERFLVEEDIFKYYVFDVFNYICNVLDSYYDYCPEEAKSQYFAQMQSGLRARYNSMSPQAQDILKNIEEVNFLLNTDFESYNKKKQTAITK